jgi:myo-inositol-1(or 4)-monophosphatase
MRHWRDRGRLTVIHKRAGDFVSEADIEAERHIRGRLSALRPEDGWLGEETGGSRPRARRWIIDPLDGTTNFLHGIPHWCVSVALQEDRHLNVGVVHDPIKNETFSAQTGGHALLNGASIEHSKISALETALFGTGIPFGTMPHIDDHAADIARLMPYCAGVRRMGSAALDLAYVASCRLDGFWERRLQSWDIAAGIVLVRQAGQQLEGWTPQERPEDSGTVIAAPKAIFDTFAEILRNN